MDDIITIIASEELTEMKLDDLIGRKGRVVEVLYSRHNRLAVRGMIIELTGEPYLNEQEWYIPIKSIGK